MCLCLLYTSHLERMQQYRIPAKARKFEVRGRRNLGRPRKRWEPEPVSYTHLVRLLHPIIVYNVQYITAQVFRITDLLQKTLLSTTIFAHIESASWKANTLVLKVENCNRNPCRFDSMSVCPSTNHFRIAWSLVNNNVLIAELTIIKCSANCVWHNLYMN